MTPHAKLVYDKKAVCQSPVCDDFERIVNIDEKGDEHISFKKVDYLKLQDSLGTVEQWSLRSLVDAGIDPDFGIKTGFNTRLAGLGVLDSAINSIEKVVNDKAE